MVRHDILDLLAAHPGDVVSGEKLSQQLNITRAAIWKQIQILKDEGFEIEAQTKSGYRLLKMPFALNAWVLKQYLETQSLGRLSVVEDKLISTNDHAKELARQGGGHGLAVIARQQSAGRGRLQRLWESPVGGLWMSVVLRPNLSLAEASKLTLAASVAIVDAVWDLFKVRLEIKWPNDLLFKGQKVVGILGEVVGEWTSVQTIILGMGINANVSREQLSTSLHATSLSEIIGHEVDLNRLAATILKYLENEVTALETKAFEDLNRRWVDRAAGLGEKVRVLRGEQVFEGVFKGISNEGTLLLETEEGEVTFSAGEVQLRSAQRKYF